jgi:integrase
VAQFFAALEDEWLRPLVYLDVATGLRHGELLGLRWSDLDLKAKTLTVRASLLEQNGRVIGLDSTKTDKDRVITLPESVVAELNTHRRELLARGLICEWVFPNRKKAPLLQGTVRRAFYRAAQKAGLPQIRVHDLRHTMATLLLKSGTNVKVVQERLGHGQVQVTLNTYAHVLPSMQDAAADTMDQLLKVKEQ